MKALSLLGSAFVYIRLHIVFIDTNPSKTAIEKPRLDEN